MITNPFRDRLVRDWLFQHARVASPGFRRVSTMGSSPFRQVEFDDLLHRHGLQPQQLGPDTKILIIGRREWTESGLDELLRARSGQKLRIYSQEMFLAYLLTGTDPLKSDRKVLERFGRGHPALEFLTAVGFDWPTTLVQEGGGSHLSGDWPSVGFLGYMGYAVGYTGPSELERHAALRRAYYARALPYVFPQDYRAGWGRPRSSSRLQKIAQSIASFCKNAKRRQGDMSLAIAEWESDMNWLRANYYDGRFRFEWPSTEVW